MSDAQVGDVRLINNPQQEANAARVTSTPGVEFGIEIVNGTMGMTAGFDTAVKLSLWGGNYLDDGTPGNIETYWGNLLETEEAPKIISRTQHLLRSLPLVTGNLRLLEDAVRADLAWFITTGIASSVDNIEVTIPAVNTIRITGEINAIGDESNFQFVENWRAGAAEQRIEVAPRGFVRPEGVSLVFDDTNTILGNGDAVLGFANEWSIMAWHRPVGGLIDNVINVDPQTGTANRIQIQASATGPGDPVALRVQLTDSGSTIFKTYVWLDVMDPDEWSQIMVTWDGTTLLGNVDGVALGAPDQFPQDTAGIMTDIGREIAFSGVKTYQGLIHQGAFWSVVLDPSEIDVIFNNGVTGLDIADDSRFYVSSDDLQHWYQLGDDPKNIGRDYGNGTPYDLTDLQNIDETNIVETAPGV